MKAWQRSALAAVLITALGLTGCQSKTDSPAQGSQGQPAAMEGTMGIVTAVSDTSIVVAVMPTGQGGLGGLRGSARPDRVRGSARPDPSARPNGQGEGFAPGGQVDTSGWEQKTFAIDGQTKITRMTRSNGNGNSAGAQALTTADLKAGDSVRITERSGSAGTADTISVMGGFGEGGPPDGSPGDQGPDARSGATPDTTSTKV